MEAEQFARVFVDLMLYRKSAAAADSMQTAAQTWTSVLKRHGVSRADIDSTLAYYERHPRRWLILLDQVIAELESRLAAGETDTPSNRPGVPTPNSKK